MARLRRASAETARRGAWAPLAVFGLHVPMSVLLLDLYELYPLVDVPMHILGGAAITFFFDRMLTALQRQGLVRELGARPRALLLLSATLTAALSWELAELTVDRLFDYGAQRGTADTVWDVVNGMVGGGSWVAARGLLPGLSTGAGSSP